MGELMPSFRELIGDAAGVPGEHSYQMSQAEREERRRRVAARKEQLARPLSHGVGTLMGMHEKLKQADMAAMRTAAAEAKRERTEKHYVIESDGGDVSDFGPGF